MAGGLQDLAVARGNLLWIPPADLIPDPDNERTDYGDIPELAASIAANGLRHPIEVRLVDGARGRRKAMVVDGHRRQLAIQYAITELKARIESVPCFPEARGTNDEQRVFNRLGANEGQKPFTPLEEAAAYKKLLALGVTEEAITKNTGKAKRYIRERLDLLAAPHDVRKAVGEGKIAASAAKSLSKAAEPERKAALERLATKKTGEGGKSTKATAKEVKEELGEMQPLNQKGIKDLLVTAEGLYAEDAKNGRGLVWDGMRHALKVVLGLEKWNPEHWT